MPAGERAKAEVLALFGPTGVGKTAVALALAELLRERGQDPVAVSADALQVYRGLELLTGVASPAQQTRDRWLFRPIVYPTYDGDEGLMGHLALAWLRPANRLPPANSQC